MSAPMRRIRSGRRACVASGHAVAPAWQAATPLRLRGKRPRRCATKQRQEIAPLHSITSSTRASSVGKIVRPVALVLLRLSTWTCLIPEAAKVASGKWLHSREISCNLMLLRDADGRSLFDSLIHLLRGEQRPDRDTCEAGHVGA